MITDDKLLLDKDKWEVFIVRERSAPRLIKQWIKAWEAVDTDGMTDEQIKYMRLGHFKGFTSVADSYWM